MEITRKVAGKVKRRSRVSLERELEVSRRRVRELDPTVTKEAVVTHLSMTTRRTPKKLTRKQLDVLYIVKHHAPVTAQDVAYHLPISMESARGILSGLNRRGLIEGVYTGHDRTGGRAYEMSRRTG